MSCIRDSKAQAVVAQTLDKAIYRINHYAVDKYQGNQLQYLLDRDLFTGQHYPPFQQLGPGFRIPQAKIFRFQEF